MTREWVEPVVAALSVIALAVAMPLYAPILADKWLGHDRISADTILEKLRSVRKAWCEFLCRQIGHDWMNLYVWGIPLNEPWSIGVRTWNLHGKGYICLRCGQPWGDVTSASYTEFVARAKAQARAEGYIP